MFKNALLVLFLFFSLSAMAVNDGDRYASGSVLAEGKWIQIKTPDNAIYKLTYEDIKGMGFSDPSKIKIHGYGGWMLDQDFSEPYVDDLPEVSVWIEKGSDGVFSSGDYLLFYGRGVVKWEYENGYYSHTNNPYATYGTYFITESEDGPKEMPVLKTSASDALKVSSFDYYTVHEKDEVSFLDSGRDLFGESFIQQSSRNFTFTIPGITSELGRMSFSFAGAPSGSTPAIMSVAGTEIARMTIYKPGSYTHASTDTKIGQWTGEKSETTTVNISYSASGASHLNYISLNARRKLQFYSESFTFFRNNEILSNNLAYEIEGATSNSLVWDITGNYDTYRMDATNSGGKLSFSVEKSDRIREFVMVNPSGSFAKPAVIGEVKNQNLHGFEQTDYIIIAPEVYHLYAEQLAERHRQNGLTVKVVEPYWVYNEFSSGTRDATAYRRFMKMFYDRAETEDEKPKYLLLFGDGVFDNRHLTTTGSRMDSRYYLLTYQIENSVAEIYGTDDYFGFLEDNEGMPVNMHTYTLDIGVGRFPVSSVEQAKNAVNKVIAYMDNKNPGNWQNKVLFTADNSDNPPSKFCGHADDADVLATYVEDNHKDYMVYKSYMDAYKPVDVNGKTTIPDAKNKFLSIMKEGCFLMQYMGHGGPRGLSSEDMLNISDVRQMNFEHLPLWITGTCDFGWSDAFTTSAGEEVFLNKNSGGIALFTTMRVVYASDNRNLSRQFLQNVFASPEGGRHALGDIMRLAKCALPKDSNKLNFILLGDPAMQLNYPHLNVSLETINGESINEKDGIFNFRALDQIVLEGTITDDEGNPVTDFNGGLRTTVFDVKQRMESYLSDGDGNKYSFFDYPNVAYLGDSQIENGRFKVSFIVPLDISYSTDVSFTGKMNFYAIDKISGIDANGYFSNYRLSGSNNDHEWSSDAPEIIEMYLNTSSFKNGDKVNATPFFVARVYDEEGINMSGAGIGHDITISIDNSPHTTYVLNSYYSPDGENEGEIRFSIPELSDGDHTLVFTVWDIMNNSARDTLTFKVDHSLKPQIADVTATNNPARESTSFRITHDRPESVMNVEVYVYDMTGRAVWATGSSTSSVWQKDLEVEWNLETSQGTRVSPGVYIYKAIISAPEGKSATKAKKIIVLGQ